MLTFSTGLALDWGQFTATWRRLSLGAWTRLLLATFLLPPALVLLLGNLLPIDRPTMAGLFLIAVAPGAPLMTRNAAKHGFDLQMAASYQVWGALLAPIMIPLLVGGATWLYGRNLWISPLAVLSILAQQLFAPLLAGMALMHFAPVLSEKLRRPLNVAGNLLLLVAVAVLLWRLGPALATVGPWLACAVLILAGACLGLTRLLLPPFPTLAVSNVNRFAGLALLLSSAHFQNAPRLVPSIAAYALAAPLVMLAYGRWRARGSGGSCAEAP